MFSAILKILGYGPPPLSKKKFARMAMNAPTSLDLVHALPRTERTIYDQPAAFSSNIPIATPTTPADSATTGCPAAPLSTHPSPSTSSSLATQDGSERSDPATISSHPFPPPIPTACWRQCTPQRVSSMVSVTPQFGFCLESSCERFSTTPTNHLLEPFSKPTGKWAWLAGRPFKETEILYGEIHIPELSLKKATVNRGDGENQESVVYLSQSFAGNHKQLPRELAVRKRALQECSDIIPPMIGLYRHTSGFSINLEAPHSCFWIEASPDMPYTLKTMCVEALQRVHRSGVLHGSLSLCNVLISPNATVSIYDFRTSRLTFELPNILKDVQLATQDDMDREMAQFKRDLRYNPAFPENMGFFSGLKREAQELFRKRPSNSKLFVIPGVGYQELADTLDAFSSLVRTMSALPYTVSLKRRHPDPEDLAPPPKRQTPPPMDRRHNRPSSRDESEEDDTSTAVNSPTGSVAGDNSSEAIISLDYIPSESPLPTHASLPEEDTAHILASIPSSLEPTNSLAGSSELPSEILELLEIPRIVVTPPEGSVFPVVELEEKEFPSLKTFLRAHKRALEAAGEEAWSTDSDSSSESSSPEASTSQDVSQRPTKRRKTSGNSSSSS